MIEYIRLENVGPSPNMLLEFGPRLNLLTGDNGLGKTFALDLAWWVLTKTWAGQPARPRADEKTRHKESKQLIACRYRSERKIPDVVSWEYRRLDQSWEQKWGSRVEPAIVIYIRVDGGFSVWDPIKANVLPGRQDFRRGRPPFTIHFTKDQVWNGLPARRGSGGPVLCNGLLQDWVLWQMQKNEMFEVLADVLSRLSPHPDETLRIGSPIRTSIEDARLEPTVELPYGTVPLSAASAGMRRVLALAYLLVWTVFEHNAATELIRGDRINRLVLLFDEVEAHLHPQWQRIILPAVFRVVDRLYTAGRGFQMQMLATSHAPLVLASVETLFDAEVDRLLTFTLDGPNVKVQQTSWAKQGDVLGWLVSDAFGLKQARSREAERAIEAAEAFMRDKPEELPKDLKTRDQIHNELVRLLPGHDPFWPRWIVRVMEGKQ